MSKCRASECGMDKMKRKRRRVHKYFYGVGCSCGWKPEEDDDDAIVDQIDSQFCMWETIEARCQNIATVSANCNGFAIIKTKKIGHVTKLKRAGRCLCLWHYNCENSAVKSTNKDKFSKWFPYDETWGAQEYWIRSLDQSNSTGRIKKMDCLPESHKNRDVS